MTDNTLYYGDNLDVLRLDIEENVGKKKKPYRIMLKIKFTGTSPEKFAISG
jgi:hypothetical protein